MSARLIINADDFGLTRGINRAIAELHDLGAVTSATLMANGHAFEDAVAVAQARPTLGVGCHIVFVDGTPVSPPYTVPTLLDADGIHFRASLAEFLTAAIAGKIKEADLHREAHAQIDRLQQHGIQPTHIDTHKHVHVLPSVARPLLAMAEQRHIRAIRNPFEPVWSIHRSGGGILRRLQLHAVNCLLPQFLRLPQIRNRTVVTTDGTLGIAVTGRLSNTQITTILREVPTGTWELVCHPGYNDSDLDTIATRLRSTRETERKAFQSIFNAQPGELTNPAELEIIHYKDLA